MTTSPSEPVDNAQLPDVSELSSGDGAPGADELPARSEQTDGGVVDQDSEPTSTAPAEDNPTVPDPPD